MALVNYTPFPAITWTAFAPNGQEHGVLLVRGGLELVAELPVADGSVRWALGPAADQTDWFGEDLYHGEAGCSSVRYESDFVPHKPRTDLVLNAVARSPHGQPCARWPCGLSVLTADGKVQLRKVLQVTGERHWQRTWSGWRLTDPKHCTSVPLRYELAYGGAIRGPRERDGSPGQWLAFCEHNPVGCGLLHRQIEAQQVPAPRIEAPQQPIADPDRHYTPEGFGFIHRSWHPRLPLAGCFDDRWLAAKHPLLPDDFDYAHNNGAHPDLVGSGLARGYLKGSETLRLSNLLPGASMQDLILPGYRLLVRLRLPHGPDCYQMIPLDTLIVDIDATAPCDWRLYLSWRLCYPLAPAANTIEVLLIKPRRDQESRHGR